MNTNLNIAVVGLGRTGWRNHLLNLQKLSDLYTIAAAVDPMEERQKEARETFGCPAFGTLEELLAHGAPDWVVIATPSTLHAAQTIRALEAGAHVLCEKPMTIASDDARAMQDAAEKAGRHLAVFHQCRFAPDFVKVSEIIESGVLGRVFQIRSCWNSFGRRWDWQTLRKNGGGVLNNTGPHAVDQLLQLFGDQEPEVMCQMERAVSLGDAEDHVKLVLRGEGAPVIDLELSSADAAGDHRWKIYGTLGTLWGTASALQWKVVDASALEKREVREEAPGDRTYNKEDLDWREHSWTAPADAEPPHLLYYRDLHARCASGLEPTITGRDGTRFVALAERCRQSAGW